MSHAQQTSPHMYHRLNTSQVMLRVIYAAIPGFLALCYFFGWGYLINAVLCASFCLGSEALILKLRKRPVILTLKDNSALLTAVLLALALPPYAPWWVAACASTFAIIITKQLYGGLGLNPFNPAMAGYALVLVSFPLQMTTTWGTAFYTLPADITAPSLGDAFNIIFQGQQLVDGYTMATPLDTYKNLVAVQTANDIFELPTFQPWVAAGWEWVSLCYLAGGLYLIYRRLITWHTPVSMLLSLSLCALIFGYDPDQNVPIHLHLLGGATLLGAFFIATDPVSSTTSTRGKLVFGAGIGVLTYTIRTWGTYPDAVAFAVLLMNFAAPFIDHYTQPRSYGHAKAKHGRATQS